MREAEKSPRREHTIVLNTLVRKQFALSKRASIYATKWTTRRNAITAFETQETPEAQLRWQPSQFTQNTAICHATRSNPQNGNRVEHRNHTSQRTLQCLRSKPIEIDLMLTTASFPSSLSTTVEVRGSSSVFSAARASASDCRLRERKTRTT